MKKFLQILGVVSLVLVLLSGCSSDGFNRFMAWGLGKEYEGEEKSQQESSLPDEDVPVSSNLPPYDDGELHEVLDAYGIYECGSAIQTTHFRLAYLDCAPTVEIDSEFFLPADGYRVVGAYFSFENTSSETYDCGGYDFNCYADDVACKSFYAARTDELDGSLDLSPGRKHEGWAFFEVPEKAQRIEIEYTGDGYWDSSVQKPIFVIG